MDERGDDHDDELLDDQQRKDRDEDEQDEPRPPTPDLSEALRAAMKLRSETVAENVAKSAPSIDWPALLPQMDIVKRFGLDKPLFQQQLEMIAKSVQPVPNLVQRLGLEQPLFHQPLGIEKFMREQADMVQRLGLGMSVYKQQFDMVAKLQMPSIIERLEFATKLPQFNVEALFPRYDFSSVFGKLDITAFLPGLELFSDLLESLRKDEPPNWGGVDIDLDVVTTIVSGDGIPLVWVPRPDIVEALLKAEDRDARVALLLAHVDDLVEDCCGVLDDVDDATLVGQQPLAVAAVAALAAGHYEAAHALAVSVTETAVSRSLGTYKQVKEQVLFDPDLVPWTQLRLRAALAPIYRFYTTWWPSTGVPAPKELSRHVSVHQANVDHYSRGNAIIAVLLVTSVLRALQELEEIAAAASDEEEVA